MNKDNALKNKPIVGSPILQKSVLILILFAFWMVLSGRSETKFIVYGLVTAVATTWITYPLLLVENKKGDKQYYVFGIDILKFIPYCFWLLWQLILANIDVLLANCGEKLRINPRVVRFYFKVDNPMATVVLANSITLTPGTVTMNVTEDGLFEVHALTDGAAEGLEEGSMQRKVAELYGEKFDYTLVESEEEL